MTQYEKFAEWYDIMYDFYDHSADCDYLESILSKYSDSKIKTILDIGCGTGSHAMELSVRGFKVTGIDLSESQIRRAMEKNTKREYVEYHVADMRDFDLGRKYDLAVSFFGSMGYVTEEDGIEKALQCIHQHLAKGGLFVFEFWNTRGVIPNHQSWLKAEQGDIKIIRLSKNRFDPNTNIIEIDFDGYVLSGKELIDSFFETHSLRVYSPREMQSILMRNSFEPLGIFENHTFEESKENSFRLTAIARTV